MKESDWLTVRAFAFKYGVDRATVYKRLGRRGVGVDLSYQRLAKERTAQQGLRFDTAANQ